MTLSGTRQADAACSLASSLRSSACPCAENTRAARAVESRASTVDEDSVFACRACNSKVVRYRHRPALGPRPSRGTLLAKSQASAPSRERNLSLNAAPAQHARFDLPPSLRWPWTGLVQGASTCLNRTDAAYMEIVMGVSKWGKPGACYRAGVRGRRAFQSISAAASRPCWRMMASSRASRIASSTLSMSISESSNTNSPVSSVSGRNSPCSNSPHISSA